MANKVLRKTFDFGFLSGESRGTGETFGQQASSNSSATGRLSDPNPVYNPPSIPLVPFQSLPSNPTIGENLFLHNMFPIKQSDNILMKGLKGLGNFGVSTLSAPGEVLRKLSLQGGSLLSGNGLADLPKNTSFTQDILPKGASSAINNFQERNPILGNIGKMALETAVDPTSYLTGNTIKNAIKGPTEGIELAGKTITDTKLPKYDPIEANALRVKNNGKYTFTTGEGRAMGALDEGTQTAQNYIRHNDILAPHKPGTTLDQAFADIKTNTGVDLPQLTSNWDKTQSLRTSLSPEELRMGRISGVIPKLKVREGLDPKLGGMGSGLPYQRLPETAPPTGLGNTAESFRAKVDRNPAKGKTFSETLKGLRTQFVDDVAPLENVEKSVNGKVASAEDSIYKQARLFRGSPERADELIQSTLSPIIKKIEKSGQSTKDLGDYALAVHAKDVNAKGINSGFNDAEITATIEKFGTPEMEAARKELIKISNDSLDSLAESGLISQELVTALREKHPNYMPLFRSFEDNKVEFASGVSKAMANVTAPINKLVGSDRNVIDPIESMIKNIYKSVSAVDRNKVAGQLGKLADNDTNGLFVRRLAEGEEKSRLNTVYAMEGGAKVHYEVQPDVYKALMNLDKESSNWLIKVLQKPAGLLRTGATLTPEFSLRNPIRDVVQAFTVSKSGLNPVTDVPRALFDVIRSKMGKDTMFNQFLKDNGGFGNIISMDRKAHQQVMSEILKQPISKKFINIVSGKSLINVLRTITDVTESATKLGEYRAALRSGASGPEAAYRARDLMDFARAGASVRETNKIVAFLNANIQGKSKLYRAIKENPAGVTARAFASITVPSMGVFMAQKYLANDEQKSIIDDAPDWMTSSFWLVPVPGTNQVARIPKPFDLAPIFANIPERAMKYLVDNDPSAFDGFAKQTMASASIPTMITGLIPFIEGMANYSFFKEGPIIPAREADINFPDQYDIRTTETAKFLAKGMNKLTGGQGPLANFGSPRIMDNTIRGATAGLGSYATSAIDFIVESTGLVDAKQKPARNISEQPLLRAFMTSEKSGGKSMGNLYDEQDKLLRNKGSLKLSVDPNNVAYKNSPLSLQDERLKVVKEATGKIGDITKGIRVIENDKSIDPQTKREKINALVTERNLLAKKAMGK